MNIEIPFEFGDKVRSLWFLESIVVMQINYFFKNQLIIIFYLRIYLLTLGLCVLFIITILSISFGTINIFIYLS